LPPSLSVRVRREFLFSVILRKSEEVLAKILKAKSVSQPWFDLLAQRGLA